MPTNIETPQGPLCWSRLSPYARVALRNTRWSEIVLLHNLGDESYDDVLRMALRAGAFRPLRVFYADGVEHRYGTVLALAVRADVSGALPAAFGLVAAVAYHHYDTVYRIRGDAGAPPAWLVRVIGGHEGRTLLVALLAAVLTASQFTVALTALAVAIALVVLVESIRFWVAAHKGGAPAVHDEGEPA